ncbi:MAG: efflux RND transporter permease subunit, partial [Candidatus Omnitrophota bacterium]|nr:efflux RND transporter permease subunit [Candidatus Omnitrophota bacterium]
GAFLIFLLSLNLVKVIDKEFMPKIDQREFIMKVNMPSGTKLQVTNKIVKKIENILLDTKEINGVTVSIGSSKKKDYAQGLETMGSHQSQIIITLKKGKKWAATSSVIEKLKDHLDQLDLQAAEIEYVLQESVFKSALQGSAPIVIEVKGKDLDKIEKIALEVKEGLSKVQGIYGVRTSLTSPAPETKVNIIKDKAALYNLSTAVIAETAHTALKGVVATKFKEEGMEIDIRVRLRKEDREYLSHVRTLWIYSPLNIEVPLSEVAYITHGMGPSEIKRLDQQRVVLVTANIAGRALDKVINNINTLVEGIESNLVEDFQGLQGIEKDVTIDLSGESQQMNESFTSLGFALLLSIILVYMIMAAQFESLSQPFIIMFTLPLSMMGVLIALYITHTPISVVVMLGLIILGGIVVNNGIILIDSINRLRLNGVELIKAVIDSSRTRLRPIFMTTMTTVLGLFPLALGIAEGSQLQSPMAITVMGGLLVSTVFTLFVIPCVYVIAAELIPGGFAVKLESKKIKKEKIVKLEAPSEKKVIVLPSPPPPAPPRAPSPPEVPAPPESPALPPSSPAASKPAPSPPAPTPVPPEDLKDKEKEAELLSLNKRQRKILERLKELKRITRQEYAEFFDISVPTAARDLKELVNKEYLIAQGPFGPGRWYELK